MGCNHTVAVCYREQMAETKNMEKFLSTPELIEKLNEYGLRGNKVKVHRWMNAERPMPHHRPGGPKGDPFFLWSEVYAWAKTAWFEQTPDRNGEDASSIAFDMP